MEQRLKALGEEWKGVLEHKQEEGGQGHNADGWVEEHGQEEGGQGHGEGEGTGGIRGRSRQDGVEGCPPRGGGGGGLVGELRAAAVAAAGAGVLFNPAWFS